MTYNALNVSTVVPGPVAEVAMFKVVRVLLVLALMASVLGYFRNWYTVSRLETGPHLAGPHLDGQHINILLQIDRQRISEDLQRAATRVRGMADRSSPDRDTPPVAEPNSYGPYYGQ
jgi:hypothetical protein